MHFDKQNQSNYELENPIFKDEVIIVEKNHRIGWMFLVLLLALFLAGFGTTYSYIHFRNASNLNKDIDNDGIADINIDLTGNGKCDINCDVNNDDKPDYNIDYKGNRKAIFNVDTNKDGKPDRNLVNQYTGWKEKKYGPGDYLVYILLNGNKCDLNCDTNNDGWPDINLDLNGDGYPDVDIDINGDGKADINLDLTGNGQCDLNCDTDGDGKCDTNCVTGANACKDMDDGSKTCEIIEKEIVKEVIIEKYVESGSSIVTGNNVIFVKGSKLAVTFTDTNEVHADSVMPDDHTEPEYIPRTIIPDKTFTIENTGDVVAKYSLKWIVTKNEFASGNLKFKVSSTDGGGSITSWTSLPLGDYIFLPNIFIDPGVIQSYTVSFTLEGTGNPQNEDQSKTFNAHINVELAN